MESLIGNYREGVFQPTFPSLIYYYSLGKISNTDENVLPYCDGLVDAKYKTFDKSYLEDLNNYIVAEILLSGEDAIPVLAKVKKRKCDANNLPV